MMATDQNQLRVEFPAVHPEARCRIDFQRTLRVPDDNLEHALPAGLGKFPLRHVDDYTDRLPAAWARRGGVLLPMYQCEALWINFHSDYPFAIKVAAGKINAVTGDAWSQPLQADPQDYLAIPEQPWLDGFSVGKGVVRQFVAMPLGEGYTAEEQLTGEAVHGGIQLIVYPMKAAEYEKRCNRERFREVSPICFSQAMHCMSFEMGLAPGGVIRQSIAEDPYGLSAWGTAHHERCFVHLLNSQQYQHVTGEATPPTPIDAEAYDRAGIPWFDYYTDTKPVGGGSLFEKLKSVAAVHVDKGKGQLPGNRSTRGGTVRFLNNGERTTSEDYQRYARQFADATIEELIEAYNEEVPVTGWVSMLGIKLAALHSEFERRPIDTSLILAPDGQSMNMHQRIALDPSGTRLVPAGNQAA